MPRQMSLWLQLLTSLTVSLGTFCFCAGTGEDFAAASGGGGASAGRIAPFGLNAGGDKNGNHDKNGTGTASGNLPSSDSQGASLIPKDSKDSKDHHKESESIIAKLLKAAFIRHGHLWIKTGDNEEQLTKTGEVFYPSWSPSGQWIVYLKESANRQNTEVWAYSVSGRQHYRLSAAGWNPRWSPNQDWIAFQVDDGLKVIALTARGPSVPLVLRLTMPLSSEVPMFRVGNYSWLPDASGFIISSVAQFGEKWTHAAVYRLSLKKPLFVGAPSIYNPSSVTEAAPKLTKLFVIPKYVPIPGANQSKMPGIGVSDGNLSEPPGINLPPWSESAKTPSVLPKPPSIPGKEPGQRPSQQVKEPAPSILGVDTTGFKFSPDGRWIAFVIAPTASWSMDSDVLCVLRNDGREFHPLAEVLARNEDWFAWAPKSELLAYIEGGDRIAFRNKHLTTVRISAQPVRAVKALEVAKARQTWTPLGYAESSFDWVGPVSLITSRMKEVEGFPAATERPFPELYQVGLATGILHKPFTAPPKGAGDFYPQYLASAGKIGWVRSNRDHGDVWLADTDGSHAHVWLKDIDPGNWYYEQWDWRRTLAWYEPPHNYK